MTRKPKFINYIIDEQELCAAIYGQGKKMDKSIRLGMRWLISTIQSNYERLDERVQRDVTKQKERLKQEKAEKAERVRKIREERCDE